MDGDVELDAAQRAVVDHDAGPLRVLGSFGSGASTALRARAARLAAEGRVPLLLHHRDLVPFAVGLLRRHGLDVALASSEERSEILRDVVGEEHEGEAARAVLGFQTSWLGDEELRVHADAAGELHRAERLIDVTGEYLHRLERQRLVDPAGAVVQAGLALRDEAVLATERDRFDELLIDDFQLATFAEARLLTQLAGRGGPLVVAGNPEAAVSEAPLASADHLGRFDRRFACPTVELRTAKRTPGVPNLHLAGAEDEADDVVARATATGAQPLRVTDVADAVGREWPVVVVVDAGGSRWPRPRPQETWFDEELFHGPDVPDEDERVRRWREAERRRFRVAVTRATQRTEVVSAPPAAPFVDQLLR